MNMLFITILDTRMSTCKYSFDTIIEKLASYDSHLIEYCKIHSIIIFPYQTTCIFVLYLQNMHLFHCAVYSVYFILLFITILMIYMIRHMG